MASHDLFFLTLDTLISVTKVPHMRTYQNEHKYVLKK
jgi:hypothetical protein